jgi:hypothetical protein
MAIGAVHAIRLCIEGAQKRVMRGAAGVTGGGFRFWIQRVAAVINFVKFL